VFTVRADSPVKNARDLVEVLRKNPEAWAVGVSNLGGTNHLTYTLLAKWAGIEPKRLKVVVFKSNTEGIAAALGGHLNMVSSAITSVMPHVRAGNARIIAIGAPRRMGGALASVPTLREQGVNVVASNWRGIIGAKGLSAVQVAYWEDVLSKVTATEEWNKSLEAQSWNGNFLRSREFAKYLENDYNQTRVVMSDLDLAK
jgi:putative tricarboxylic transport membrane protein